jgi:carbonic anhydrase
MRVRRVVLSLTIVAALCAWTGVPAGARGYSPAAEALARLKSGNATFVANPESPLPIDAARRSALAQGQTPFATVLSCADSRVAPEVIFHTGLGDLFVVRAAGNVTDRAILGSIEYGAEHLKIPLVVVMGHESCGAVKAAIDTPIDHSMGPNLDYLVKAIRPSVTATASSPEASRLRAAILRNVEESVNDLADESGILKHLWETNAVMFVGAYYELTTGRVHFSEPAIAVGGGK